MNRFRTCRVVRLGGLVAALSLVGACGSDSESDGPAAASGTATVEIDGAWARTSPSMTNTGAAYVRLTAGQDDTLVGVEASTTIADVIEIHETVAMDSTESDTTMGDADSDETGSGLAAEAAPMEMTMRPVERIELPEDETVALEPGGYHIMLMELAAPLELGQTFSMELIFEKAGTKSVTFEVRDDAP